MIVIGHDSVRPRPLQQQFPVPWWCNRFSLLVPDGIRLASKSRTTKKVRYYVALVSALGGQ